MELLADSEWQQEMEERKNEYGGYVGGGEGEKKKMRNRKGRGCSRPEEVAKGVTNGDVVGAGSNKQ